MQIFPFLSSLQVFNPCPLKTPVVSHHFTFLIYRFFNLCPLEIFVWRERHLGTFSHCCHSVWVQFERFITLAFNAAQLCFFPAEDKFEKFKDKSFLAALWDLVHITERRLFFCVDLKIAGPTTICALTKEADAFRVLWFKTQVLAYCFHDTKVI